MPKISIFLLLSLAILVFGIPVAAGMYYGCNYHAYRDCYGTSIYWYDSCSNRQDLVQDCAFSGLICKYGLCEAKPITPTPQPYVAHYRTACYGDNLYWYDSRGLTSGLHTNCQDSNSCTADACASAKCSNTIKCDGSTCATGSADYNSYCAPQTAGSALSVTFLAKKDASAGQWNKAIQLGSEGNAYFLITVTNSSSAQVNDIVIKASIPVEVGYLGNLKVNDVPVAGDIVTGVNIGSLAPAATKTVTFEGRTQAISVDAAKDATATAITGDSSQTDSVAISFSATQVQAASVSSAETASGFWAFLKRWYLWILVLLVLIFLFIVVFRRLSSSA